MRLTRARVQNYRSVKDSGWFDIELGKTIMVGPNEAGKTAVMRALEHLKRGPIVKPLDILRDYPRSEYHRFRQERTDPATVVVVEAEYVLEEADRRLIRTIAPAFENCRYYRSVGYGNTMAHKLLDGPDVPTIGAIRDRLRELAAYADAQLPAPAISADLTTSTPSPSSQLNNILGDFADTQRVEDEVATSIRSWLYTVAAPHLDNSNKEQSDALAVLRSDLSTTDTRTKVLTALDGRVPVMVYFSNYTRVTPVLHLGHLADRLDQGDIDQADTYNFGNSCLLKLLGYTARELSDLGRAADPEAGDLEAFERYRAQLDDRTYKLNAASLELTQQVEEVWHPSKLETDDYRVTITADQQYLRVGVTDSLGALVEIDQRSEGFQWLVSFLIVFFAQTSGALKNSVLLLDEPGLSLHGLKQREFRGTLSKLAQANQLMFTTHSPFLVGPNELDIVRVVELVDRPGGTKVHTQIIADDPASLLPLQEALGYDLAQSLFEEQRSLLTKGLTDYWYLDATSSLLRDAGIAEMNEKIAIVPAGDARKVVYFATILHAHDLQVAALLDDEAKGERSANQESLVHRLGNNAILRTKDAYNGPVARPQIEDLLRETLVTVARDILGWDVSGSASRQPASGIVDIFGAEIDGFSQYRLAKAYLRWTRDHSAGDLAEAERGQWKTLIERINGALEGATPAR